MNDPINPIATLCSKVIPGGLAEAVGRLDAELERLAQSSERIQLELRHRWNAARYIKRYCSLLHEVESLIKDVKEFADEQQAAD